MYIFVKDKKQDRFEINKYISSVFFLKNTMFNVSIINISRFTIDCVDYTIYKKENAIKKKMLFQSLCLNL